ncbi:hypothetical protein AHAS_Ahas01G0097800 [Arachis hypogaea]
MVSKNILVIMSLLVLVVVFIPSEVAANNFHETTSGLKEVNKGEESKSDLKIDESSRIDQWQCKKCCGFLTPWGCGTCC